MLNLRTVDPMNASLKTASAYTPPGAADADTVRFAHGTILGNIGAPLRTDDYDAD